MQTTTLQDLEIIGLVISATTEVKIETADYHNFIHT